MEETDSNYTWILLVGVVVFLFVIIVLLCFTKASGERLFYSEDSIYEETIVETPAMMASLSVDARLSYEQAKCKLISIQPTWFLITCIHSLPTTISTRKYTNRYYTISICEYSRKRRCSLRI